MAADVSARVHLVAEKLQQKAQDAQRKGNDNIARALSASVSDLRQAMALISEQRHLLARRRAEGVDEEDDADAHVQQLATQLGRVEAMLGKKSEDMKVKGNENAAGALQQSAATVEQGRKLLLEQQQQIFGLLGRWEKIQDVVSDKERRRGSVATSGGEGGEKELETPHEQVIARARQLKQLEALLKEVFPECNEMEELREELKKVRDQREGKSEQIKNECEQLHQELKAAKEKLEESRQETLEVNQMLEQESSTLEEAKKELAKQKEREIQRQGEVSALLEQQTETCHAMEELDALVTEKDQVVNKYADEIEKLRDQLESATVAVSEITEEASTEQCQEDIEMNLNVDGAENDHVSDVPVLELEGVGLQPTDIAVEEQVETTLAENGADFKDSPELEGTHADLRRKLADYEEQSQVQQDTISTLEQEQSELQQQIEHLTNAKAQVIEDLHSGKEETERLMQQLSALEREQGKFQQQNELFTKDKQQVIDELQSAHEEEALRLLQRITDSDNTVEELSAQLAEMQEALKVKSAEKSEVTSALERCEVELSSCRTELEDRAHECSKLQGDLQSTQDVKDAEHSEVDKRLSLLIGELREIIIAVHSDGQLDATAVHDFTGKTWQSPETTELCSCLTPLLNDLILVQEQLLTTKHQLDVICSESDEHKLVIQQFMETTDARLFVKGVEEGSEFVSKSNSGASESLAVAKTNISRWLEELEELRGRAEKDLTKIKSLEQENEQEHQRVITLESSLRDLQVLVDSLREQLALLQGEKDEITRTAEKLQAQNQSASVQEQQQQAAQQEEVADLQQQLVAVRNDFERYRLRSHTALKKIEKRAELLNGMRKENDELLKQVTESNQEREQAEAARKTSEAHLQEVQRTQEMRQADFDQYAAEKGRAIAELEEETQRLESERAQVDNQIQELMLKIQELEMEKNQLEEECQRVKEAEQAAFEARLSTAANAVQTAKQDLLKVQDALAASKAENDKRQQRIDSLEATLEHQETKAATNSSVNGSSPVAAYTTKKTSAPSQALNYPLDEAKRNMDALHNELATLKTSESSLRTQLDDARAELIALQERFATTKAANAEKVFALEEQINHLKMQLATTSKEVHQLNTVIETRNSTTTQQSQGKAGVPDSSTVLDAAHTTGVTEKQLRENLGASTAQIQRMSEELRELKIELADATTEVLLHTRALDTCREELQEARDQIDLLAPSSSEPENGEDRIGVVKSAKVLVAKEEALKKLRLQVLELQEELHTLQEEKAARELEREQKELDELQTSRQKMQSEKELALRLQRREALVAGFEKQVSSIVKELQQRLENHSTAFREVCDFRDEHRASLFAKDSGADNVEGTTGHKGEIEYDECLVMRSGVVIKAGASFQLPVICEKRGWRVVWNFTVKEEATDVAFKLTAIPKSNATEIEIVASERMNEKSGVFQVQHDNTTLVFEWDNSFSWLNEKTLDYHVSIQEPLTPQAQKVRHSKRELQFKAKLLEDGLALIQGEAERRSDLSATLEQLHECESAKETHLAEFAARKEEVLAQKTRFQEDMEAQKTILSAMLQEQDELEDIEHNIARAWAAAAAERQDVEMTLQLAGSLEALTQELEQQVMIVAEELARPITTTAETVNNSKSEDSECKGPEGVKGVAEIREVKVDSSVHSSPEEKHGQPSVENHPEDASTELTTKDSSVPDDQ